MTPKNNDYKLIAIASLAFALFSCTQTASSDDNTEVLAQLDEIGLQLDAVNARLDTLMASVEEIQVAVAGPEPTGSRPCTIDEVISQSLNGCDPTVLPADVGVSTTYCINQGRAGSLGATFMLEPEIEIDIGAGWPNVIWGKMTGKATIPPIVPIGPVVVPLPNEIAAAGEMSLGRGIGICVDIPIRSLGAPEIAQVHALVRGVNVSGGKYARRTGRVLNYAAVRTPIAEIDPGTSASFGKVQFQAAEDSFDVAEAAFEKLINGEFPSVTSSGLQIFSDPTFQDLAGALELPQPVLDTIGDPDRIFSTIQTISQNNIANACNRFGISTAVRGRFPAIENQCDRFALYPNISRTLGFPNRLNDVWNQVTTGLQSFICGNVTLSILSDC